MYVDRALDFLWLCCGYWTRRPSNLEAFCKGLERSTQRFIMNLTKRESNFKHTHVHAEQDRVMRIGPRQKCMRMDTGSSSERTEHSRGGASLQSRRGVSL